MHTVSHVSIFHIVAMEPSPIGRSLSLRADLPEVAFGIPEVSKA
jgi:hypothetical protein